MAPIPARIIQALVQGSPAESQDAITQSDATMLRAIGAVWPNYAPGTRESTNVEIRPQTMDGLSARQKAAIFASIFGNEMGAFGSGVMKSVKRGLGMNANEGQQLLPGPRMEPR